MYFTLHWRHWGIKINQIFYTWVLRMRRSADDLFVSSSCSIFCSNTTNKQTPQTNTSNKQLNETKTSNKQHFKQTHHTNKHFKKQTLQTLWINKKIINKQTKTSNASQTEGINKWKKVAKSSNWFQSRTALLSPYYRNSFVCYHPKTHEPVLSKSII